MKTETASLYDSTVSVRVHCTVYCTLYIDSTAVQRSRANEEVKEVDSGQCNSFGPIGNMYVFYVVYIVYTYVNINQVISPAYGCQPLQQVVVGRIRPTPPG